MFRFVAKCAKTIFTVMVCFIMIEKTLKIFSISCHRDYKGPATLFVRFSFTLPLTESYVSISSGELLLLSSISIFLLCSPNNYLAPLFVYSLSIKLMLRIYCEHFCYASS